MCATSRHSHGAALPASGGWQSICGRSDRSQFCTPRPVCQHSWEVRAQERLAAWLWTRGLPRATAVGWAARARSAGLGLSAVPRAPAGPLLRVTDRGCGKLGPCLAPARVSPGPQPLPRCQSDGALRQLDRLHPTPGRTKPRAGAPDSTFAITAPHGSLLSHCTSATPAAPCSNPAPKSPRPISPLLIGSAASARSNYRAVTVA